VVAGALKADSKLLVDREVVAAGHLFHHQSFRIHLANSLTGSLESLPAGP